MLDLTLLTKEQACDDNFILKKYEIVPMVTDFSTLLGNSVACWWWTKSSNKEGKICCINALKQTNYFDANVRRMGILPVLKYSVIKDRTPVSLDSSRGIKQVMYGEYPQTLVDEEYSNELEQAYINNTLLKTGKIYTNDSVSPLYSCGEFENNNNIEYEYNKNRYIRFEAKENRYSVLIANQTKNIEKNKPYWIKVEPITWLVDEENDIALSKFILFTGIKFNDSSKYNGYFEESFIKQFMDEYLSKEIECSMYKGKLIENKQVDIDQLFEETIKKMNEINEVEEVKKLTKRITI